MSGVRRARPSPQPARDRAGHPARRAAAQAVREVLDRGVPLDEVLTAGASPDGALARAIATTTFRRFGTIRAALETRLAKGLPRDLDAVAVLATGAAQILFLDIPDHAAVDIAVQLASDGPRTRHMAGMVNAVLRRVARERDLILSEQDPVTGDLPDWLAERWRTIYGEARTEAIAAAQRAGAPLDITVKSDPEGWAERLDGVLLPTGSIRIRDRRPVSELPGYPDGEWWVQDAAAALPARLLAPRPGERILDLCAAPGGKTAQLAAAGASVTALDRSEHRLERLAANMKRLNLTVEIVCADALAFEGEPYDAVLLDAPCTATGTIRRHPDIGWTKRPEDIASLGELQRRLLERAASLVRPGGRLVYCVCSLEPEEGERQAEAFAASHPDFVREPVDVASLGLTPDFVTASGDLRTVPDLWPPRDGERAGLDGFFACRLSRRST